MTDIRLFLFGSGITAVVSAGAVWAQAPTDEAPPPSSVSERLAWSIQAYVPCDWTNSLATIEAEIVTSGADDQEIGQALNLVLVNEGVCDPVKDASARLLTRLPEELPATEDEVIAVEPTLVAAVSDISEPDVLADLASGNVGALPATEVDRPDEPADLTVPASSVDDMLIAEAGDVAVEPVSESETSVSEQALDVSFKMRLPPGNPAFAGN